MMQRKKVLYVMGIDWNWIYQRPQVFAEKLAQDFDVTVVFPRSILKNSALSQKRESDGRGHMEFRMLRTIPYQEKNTLVGKLASIFATKIWGDIEKFDYIYIGYPLYARYIPEGYTGKIIYDCMDDFEKLYPDRKRVYRVTERERPLVNRCDLLLASSRTLMHKVDEIAGYEKSKLVRNGLKQCGEVLPIKGARVCENYRLCYIGTISEWMDYELLTKSCREIPNVQYDMIGPVVKRTDCEGIHYIGVVEHGELGKAVAGYDCLIMPFVVNDIIRAVDPVKLYEYIAFGKCIISVWYPEIDRFQEFVYFYRTDEEYIRLLEELMVTGFAPKYDEEQRDKFLRENTWDERYETLKEEIQKLG